MISVGKKNGEGEKGEGKKEEKEVIKRYCSSCLQLRFESNFSRWRTCQTCRSKNGKARKGRVDRFKGEIEEQQVRERERLARAIRVYSIGLNSVC